MSLSAWISLGLQQFCSTFWASGPGCLFAFEARVAIPLSPCSTVVGSCFLGGCFLGGIGHARHEFGWKLSQIDGLSWSHNTCLNFVFVCFFFLKNYYFLEFHLQSLKIWLAVQKSIIMNQRSGFLVHSMTVLGNSECKQGEQNISIQSTRTLICKLKLLVEIHYLCKFLLNIYPLSTLTTQLTWILRILIVVCLMCLVLPITVTARELHPTVASWMAWTWLIHPFQLIFLMTMIHHYLHHFNQKLKFTIKLLHPQIIIYLLMVWVNYIFLTSCWSWCLLQLYHVKKIEHHYEY